MALTILKRDGVEVIFDSGKIQNAIIKALRATGLYNDKLVNTLSKALTVTVVDSITPKDGDTRPVTVEYVQDRVEEALMAEKLFDAARAYITYRHERTRLRSIVPRVSLPPKRKWFHGPYQEFIYLRTYSKWIPHLGRRECWPETIDRFMTFLDETDIHPVTHDPVLTPDERDAIRESILYHKVMPSMRLLQFAGPAAHRNHLCVYNCCFIAPTDLKSLVDIMYVTMCGTGVGWSVEHRFIDQLPVIAKQTGEKRLMVVPDSKEGWCDAFYAGLTAWFGGNDIEFDYSKVRPAGARNKISGGRSSGPAPLKELLAFARQKILKRQGDKLTTLDVHDIICMVGRIVVVGGVRRSAMISLSDVDDSAIRDCKSGAFWNDNIQRCGANNSATYDEVPSDTVLMEEWMALVKSGSGERGIFNRSSLSKCLPERRLQLLGDRVKDLGTNPCGEILLQSHGLCNLSTVVCRPDDTLDTLKEKIRMATIIGTWQSTLTDFKYVDARFKLRAEEERLLGVSMTGQYDCPVLRDPQALEALKEVALSTNREYAARFGVSQSSAVTCVKPEGTVSEMVNTSSGLHPRYGEYYVRRVRVGANDPLCQLQREQGVPIYPEVGENPENARTYVVEYPVKSPEGSLTQDKIGAIELLERWKLLKVHYTEHNPSVTISVGSNEWIEVLAWVKANWDIVGGLSFLPRDDHVYQLAPFERISAQEYEQRLSKLGDVDFSKLPYYEKDDTTDVKREMACVAGGCYI